VNVALPSAFLLTPEPSSPVILDMWAYQSRHEDDFSRPGKPTDKAFIETFNGTFRDECMNLHWFETVADARMLIEAWRNDYESRAHMALGNQTPQEYVLRAATLQPAEDFATVGN
jgi:putative transposase